MPKVSQGDPLVKRGPSHSHPFPRSPDDEQALLEAGFQRVEVHFLIYDVGPYHYIAVDTRDACWSLGRDSCGETDLSSLWQPRHLNDVLLLIKIFETGPR